MTTAALALREAECDRDPFDPDPCFARLPERLYPVPVGGDVRRHRREAHESPRRSMVLLRRRTVLAEDPLTAKSFVAVQGIGWRVYLSSTRRLSFDSARVPTLATLIPRAAGIRELAVPIAGEYVVRIGGRELIAPPGVVASMVDSPSTSEVWCGARFDILVIEWNPSRCRRRLASGLDTVRIGPADSFAAAQFAQHLAGARTVDHGLADATLRLLQRLGSTGLPLPDLDAADLCAAPAAVRALSETLSREVSNVAHRTNWIDLEQSLGVSAREMRRRLYEFDDWLGIVSRFGGLRSYLKVVRLFHACQLLTAPAVSIERVARAVGYGSTRALDLAFHVAGLPSPSELRRA